MRINSVVFAAVILLLPLSVLANSRIKIDSVPAGYTPYPGISKEPVSLSGFHFEVNEQTGRARVVAVYGYPENMPAGRYDDRGPDPTVAQVQGLVYDAQNQAVVYDSGNQRTVCALVQKRGGLRGGLRVKSTGACTVSTEPNVRAVDDGWDIHHVRVLDVYLDVR